MKYAGCLKQSLLDYPDEIATVLFTRGCNFRCPFCHNPDLLVKLRAETTPPGIEGEEVRAFLLPQQSFIDAVVITGGEPCLHPELVDELALFKAMGFLCKLDTNGSRTTMLEILLRHGWLDYVAMDIKAPLNYRSYNRSAGKLSREDFFQVRSSIELLRRTEVKVQFRTTVVPALHTPEDIESIARYIEGSELYVLQQFNPRITLETGYASVSPYSRDEMEVIAESCRRYVQTVRLVNI